MLVFPQEVLEDALAAVPGAEDADEEPVVAGPVLAQPQQSGQEDDAQQEVVERGLVYDRARQQGQTAISLSAEKGMTKLYERFGFRAVEEKDGTVTMKAELT